MAAEIQWIDNDFLSILNSLWTFLKTLENVVNSFHVLQCIHNIPHIYLIWNDPGPEMIPTIFIRTNPELTPGWFESCCNLYDVKDQ